ncbi:CBS domain-containing protein [Thermanaerosceptrum fracticalcis]|uniref:CBS domain-containing protein n=1 Tax=Thermanaerosceptrum fracticalcis TaxID=1712410 RepID=A0A7G6E6G5_THEFR|nr:CBS domain-containing protein [Thermanaerosceptrum fracticalcis]QNB47669.1 CBS domain-containing protein [Thermanaerosceptrum fracticalcis]
MKGEALGSSLTKHEQIIRFIKNLEVGTKVSVRQIAKELDVSEGTAYRAIKEAEAQGLVSSIPKVGTIRIEAEEQREIEDLTLREISLIVEGEVLCSTERLGLAPSRFVIGCNSIGILEQLLEKDALLIVGDVPEFQRIALEKGSHLMVAGAFKVSKELIKLAQENNLVIISCPYDTFVAVSMMNRAVYDRLTEKELVRVEDIMVRDVFYLTSEATVEQWHEMAQKTGHSRFPVVDQNMLVIGIVTAVDVAGIDRTASVLSVMTKDVLIAERQTLVTHLARLLIWEGFELVPIVEEGRLVGVVSRQDILKAFQQTQKQPHVGETVDNLVMSGFTLDEWDEGTKISGEITQFMINEFGSASPGTLVTIMSTATYIALRKQLRLDTVLDNLTLYHMDPVEVGDFVEVYTRVIHIEKKSCVTDVSIYCEGKLKAKGILSSRIIKK